MTRKAFGLWLQKKREECGKTQSDVSRELGYLTAQFVSNIERGNAPMPIFKIKAWAKAIKADANEIFEMQEKARTAEAREEFKNSRAVSA